MGESLVRRAAMAAMIMVVMVTALGALVVWQSDAGRARGAGQVQEVSLQLVPVAGGFTRPLYVTHAGDGSGRLFVVEQSGAIRVIKDGEVLGQPFLDVSGLISRQALEGDYTERGLLGLAFHPNYAENGLFYINYTDLNGHSVISRYTVSADDPDRADATSTTPLLYVEQPYANHNGGHMAFGPDGYLYISLGDGGSGGDPQGHGQNLATLLGAILRVDVDVPDGYAIPADNPFVDREGARPEIWAWGLRNVWRFSFDRATGDLYLADVGQNQWEEINFQLADSAGGENYGWNAFEGTHVYSGQPAASDVVAPVLEYNHSNGRCSVTGGYVYRGERISPLQGAYLYGDWCSGTIWSATPGVESVWEAFVPLESGRSISSFGEDEAGELYLVDYSGEVLRLEPAAGG